MVTGNFFVNICIFLYVLSCVVFGFVVYLTQEGAQHVFEGYYQKGNLPALLI